MKEPFRKSTLMCIYRNNRIHLIMLVVSTLPETRNQASLVNVFHRIYVMHINMYLSSSSVVVMTAENHHQHLNVDDGWGTKMGPDCISKSLNPTNSDRAMYNSAGYSSFDMQSTYTRKMRFGPTARSTHRTLAYTNNDPFSLDLSIKQNIRVDSAFFMVLGFSILKVACFFFRESLSAWVFPDSSQSVWLCQKK